MHWSVVPFLVTAVAAAAVEEPTETDREGKCKKIILHCAPWNFNNIIFSVQCIPDRQI